MSTPDRTQILAHELVVSEGRRPDRWMLFLHGILGTRGNWRSFARQWVHRRPEWGAVLVDLRHHGGSLRAMRDPRDETVAACARDLDAIAPPGRVAGVLGHSFGGKVALEWVVQRHGDLDRAIIVDTGPGARPDARGSEAVVSIVSLLERAPRAFRERAGFGRWLEAEGVPRAIAQWLAMNVRREPDDTFTFAVDVAAVKAMLDDYFVLDLWGALEDPPGRVEVTFVMGDASPVLLPEDRARLRAAAARRPDRVACHELRAGHWVHVDAPNALLELVVSAT